MHDTEDPVSENDANVHHRSIFENDDVDPSMELLAIVSELKGVAETDLDPLYDWVDSLLGDLYSFPPPAAAQAMVIFTYEGYRITLYQDGHAVFTGRSSA